VFEGFPDKVNNVAWVVRLSVDRQGVRAWQAHRVDIDRQGLPHAANRAIQEVTLR
jgi:hypothetical protein